MRRLACVILCSLLVLPGCNDKPTDPSGSGSGSSGGSGSGGSGGTGSGGAVTLSNGSMSATIDGVRFDATVSIIITTVGQVLSIFGASTTTSLSVTSTATAPGTYTVASTAASAQLTAAGGVSGIAASTSAGSSGTITYTTRTASRATGTFEFTMVAGPLSVGTPSTRRITEGRFDVTF